MDGIKLPWKLYSLRVRHIQAFKMSRSYLDLSPQLVASKGMFLLQICKGCASTATKYDVVGLRVDSIEQHYPSFCLIWESENLWTSPHQQGVLRTSGILLQYQALVCRNLLQQVYVTDRVRSENVQSGLDCLLVRNQDLPMVHMHSLLLLTTSCAECVRHTTHEI